MDITTMIEMTYVQGLDILTSIVFLFLFYSGILLRTVFDGTNLTLPVTHPQSLPFLNPH